jgi:hypothetical protein
MDGSLESVLFTTIVQSRVVLSSEGPIESRLVESTVTRIVSPCSPRKARAGVSGRSIGPKRFSQLLFRVLQIVKISPTGVAAPAGAGRCRDDEAAATAAATLAAITTTRRKDIAAGGEGR